MNGVILATWLIVLVSYAFIVTIHFRLKRMEKELFGQEFDFIQIKQLIRDIQYKLNKKDN